MTAMNIKVGQVWKHVDNNQQYLVVGISDNLFILKDHGVKGYVHSPFDLQKHLQHYQLISEWDGAVRTGQRWEYLTIDNEWVPLIIHEGDILLRSKLKDHINNPIPHYRYIGEAENKQFPEEITVYASKQDKGKYSAQAKAGFIKKKENVEMKRLKFAEVELVRVAHVTIRAKMNELASVLNHDATEIDGKVYFRMPDKLVGEFEVSPAELDKLLRTKILEGDQTVIDFAISSGILVRGTFVVK